MAEEKRVVSRKKQLITLTILFSAGMTFLVGEGFLRLLSPQASMYPRREFSPHYGFERYRSTPVVHEVPGEWRFDYTINEYRYRGEAIPISNRYSTQNIVVLGDSYTFGLGVHDGEEYPAVMRQQLGSEFEVINLGIGGWGLTQQIRKFYEFGQAYQPALVVLQFTSNDPSDNLANRVTTVEEGRFVFHDSVTGINWIKKYLSESLIQKSQLYNLFRDSAYRFFESRTIENAILEQQQAGGAAGTATIPERVHAELLEAFATDLASRGTPLLLISVDGDLEKFPFIWEQVRRLDAERKLSYYEVRDWLEDETDYGSPEGHIWGARAHALIGQHLADVVEGVLGSDAAAGLRTARRGHVEEAQLP